MNLSSLQESFARLGARVTVESVRSRRNPTGAVRLDVRRDQRGERFHIVIDPLRLASLEVLDMRRAQRQLLLVARHRRVVRASPLSRQAFLCGRDNQGWFVTRVSISAMSTNAFAAGQHPQDFRSAMAARIPVVKAFS